jgi:hypothetical protein
MSEICLVVRDSPTEYVVEKGEMNMKISIKLSIIPKCIFFFVIKSDIYVIIKPIGIKNEIIY